jgi:hypothetical protein
MSTSVGEAFNCSFHFTLPFLPHFHAHWVIDRIQFVDYFPLPLDEEINEVKIFVKKLGPQHLMTIVQMVIAH